jgi:hypothetical protein
MRFLSFAGEDSALRIALIELREVGCRREQMSGRDASTVHCKRWRDSVS